MKIFDIRLSVLLLRVLLTSTIPLLIMGCKEINRTVAGEARILKWQILYDQDPSIAKASANTSWNDISPPLMFDLPYPPKKDFQFVWLGIVFIWLSYLMAIFSPYFPFSIDFRITCLWCIGHLAPILFFIYMQQYYKIYLKKVNNVVIPALIIFATLSLIKPDATFIFHLRKILGTISMVIVIVSHLFLFYRASRKPPSRAAYEFMFFGILPCISVVWDIVNYLFIYHYPPLFHGYILPVIIIQFLLIRMKNFTTHRTSEKPAAIEETNPITQDNRFIRGIALNSIQARAGDAIKVSTEKSKRAPKSARELTPQNGPVPASIKGKHMPGQGRVLNILGKSLSSPECFGIHCQRQDICCRPSGDLLNSPTPPSAAWYNPFSWFRAPVPSPRPQVYRAPIFPRNRSMACGGCHGYWTSQKTRDLTALTAIGGAFGGWRGAAGAHIYTTGRPSFRVSPGWLQVRRR